MLEILIRRIVGREKRKVFESSKFGHALRFYIDPDIQSFLRSVLLVYVVPVYLQRIDYVHRFGDIGGIRIA